MSRPTTPKGIGWDRSPDVGGRIVGAVFRWRFPILLGIGVLFLAIQYLKDRPFWLDEFSLSETIKGKSLPALFHALDNSQLAPPGFLAIEWAASRTLGDSRLALRLFPLACGIASLFLMYGVARTALAPGAAWIAVGLFAVCDDLIYYASELKPYATDVASAMACYATVLAPRSERASGARIAAWGVLGAMAVWFSFPAVFVLAGLGSALLASAASGREWTRCGRLGLMGLAWLASFAAVYSVARAQLGGSRGMWVFWQFAFPPSPATLAGDTAWSLQRSLFLFVNPLDFGLPIWPMLSALPVVGLFLIGCGSLWGRDRRLFAMFALPGAFVLSAALLRQYPFHGRLLLFLVPSLLLFIAEGARRVRDRTRRGPIRAAVLAVLFLFPTLHASYNTFFSGDHVNLHNRYGDRRPEELDPTRFSP